MLYCLCCDIIIGPLSGTLQLRKVFLANNTQALNESQQLVIFPIRLTQKFMDILLSLRRLSLTTLKQQ